MKILNNSLLILLITLLLISSCTSNENESDIQSFIINGQVISDFDQVVQSLEFIPLTNQKDNPVNLNCNVWNLKVTDDFLVYSTICNPEAKVHIFDLNGGLVQTFDRSGDGPEEYQVIQGVDLVTDTLSISVGGGLIKQYHFPDFEFIQTVTLNEEALFIPYFTKVSNHKWLTSAGYSGELDKNGEYKLFKIMESDTSKVLGLPITATPVTSEVGEGEFVKVGDYYLLNFAFSDTLYRYSKETVSPYVALEFESKESSKVDIQDLGDAVANQSITFNMGKIWETDSITRIKTFGLTQNPDFDISNRRTFEVHEVFLNYQTNEVIAFPSLAGWSNGTGFATDGFFYDVLQPDDWLYALEQNSFGKYGEELENILKGLEDFEDPVLVKYQVKTGN